MAFFGFPRRGRQDVWTFVCWRDEKTCEVCTKLDRAEIVVEIGNEDEDEVIGSVFEFAEKQNDDFYLANVHPNCRCVLEKVPNEDYR